MRIGVLALQGCIDPHVRAVEKLGHRAVRIRTPEELQTVERVILPGGESTTMLRLLAMNHLEEPLIDFCKVHPTWGVCAGSILLAKKVSNPDQRSFGLIKVHAIRNFYGSQNDSFKASVEFQDKLRPVDFIRAPKLQPLDESVKTLASHHDAPVMLREGNVVVSAFHAELGEDLAFHDYFIRM